MFFFVDKETKIVWNILNQKPDTINLSNSMNPPAIALINNLCAGIYFKLLRFWADFGGFVQAFFDCIERIEMNFIKNVSKPYNVFVECGLFCILKILNILNVLKILNIFKMKQNCQKDVNTV